MQTCRESKRDRGLVYVCVVVVAGGQLKVNQRRATGFVTGTTELPAAPVRRQLISTGIHERTLN